MPKVRDEDIDSLWRAAEESSRARQRAMPNEHAALVVLFQAWQRLRELGWSEGSYCPKDGSLFEVCGLGSTGIFACTYMGEWPNGFAMVQDTHDIYPQRPDSLLWRPIRKARKDDALLAPDRPQGDVPAGHPRDLRPQS